MKINKLFAFIFLFVLASGVFYSLTYSTSCKLDNYLPEQEIAEIKVLSYDKSQNYFLSQNEIDDFEQNLKKMKFTNKNLQPVVNYQTIEFQIKYKNGDTAEISSNHITYANDKGKEKLNLQIELVDSSNTFSLYEEKFLE